MFHHCPLAHKQKSIEGGWITSWCHFLNFHLQSHWEITRFQTWWALTCTVHTFMHFTFTGQATTVIRPLKQSSSTTLKLLLAANIVNTHGNIRQTRQVSLFSTLCKLSLQSHLVLLDLVEQISFSQHALWQFWSRNCQMGGWGGFQCNTQHRQNQWCEENYRAFKNHKAVVRSLVFCRGIVH